MRRFVGTQWQGRDMLSDKDKATLDLEAQRWGHGGTKAERVMELFGETLTAYEARVLRLMENPEALQFAPHTVRRLTRLRDARREQRSAERVDQSTEKA